MLDEVCFAVAGWILVVCSLLRRASTWCSQCSGRFADATDMDTVYPLYITFCSVMHCTLNGSLTSIECRMEWAAGTLRCLDNELLTGQIILYSMLSQLEYTRERGGFAIWVKGSVDVSHERVQSAEYQRFRQISKRHRADLSEQTYSSPAGSKKSVSGLSGS